MSDAPDHSFEEIALPFIPDVSRFAYSLTRDADEADDLVQDTFLKAYRSWHRFEPGTNVRSWLFTICKNTFRRRFKREKMRPDVEAEATGDDDAMPIVMSHVNAEQLGLDDAGLDALALRNLASRTPEEIVQRALAGDMAMVCLGDGHDAARVLAAAELLAEDQELAALLPDRESLVLAPVPEDGDWDALCEPLKGDALLRRPLMVTRDAVSVR